MADKKSFVLHLDSWEFIEELSIEERGTLLTAIYAIQLGEVLPEMDRTVRVAFKALAGQFARDRTKYEETIEARRKAGKKGAEKRWGKDDGKPVAISTNAKQAMANIGDSDSESVNVSVNVSDSDSDSVSVSDSVADSGPDDTHTLTHFGTLHNVELTREQYREITETYQHPRKLINKVSAWLPKAEHPVKDHFALVHRFALNDDWPEKPKPEKPPDPVDESRGEFMPAPESVKEKLGAFRAGLEVVEA